MSKKLQITIVLATLAVVLLLVGIFSLRQLNGAEIELDEKDAKLLLEGLGEQEAINGQHYIYAYTVKEESGTKNSIYVHQTSFSDKSEGEIDFESLKPEILEYLKIFLDEIIEKSAYEDMVATEVFSFSGGDKRVQFDFSSPIPEAFGFGDAYGCASLVFDKENVLQSLTLYFNEGDGNEVCTGIFGDVPLEAVISTGGEVVFMPIEEKEE